MFLLLALIMLAVYTMAVLAFGWWTFLATGVLALLGIIVADYIIDHENPPTQ